MISPLVLASMLSAAAPAASPPAPAAPSLQIDNGRITRTGVRPGFGSGIFAVYADFDVAAPNGAPQRMYLLWMMPDQLLPDAGSICTISYRQQPLARGNLHDHPDRPDAQDEGPHNVVEGISCDIGSTFAPPSP